MKKYTFEIRIEEGSDEFWEELDGAGSTGCDELLDMILDLLFPTGLQTAEVKLTSYTNKD